MSEAIKLGGSYSRKVGDNTELVTIERPCEWGGWYGTNEDGKSVRVTEKSLILATQYNHNVQEDTTMAAKPAARVTAADRAKRRGITASTTATAVEEALEATVEEQPTAKPVAKSTPKQTIKITNTNVKESNTMPVATRKSAPKRTSKPAAKRTPKAAPTVEVVTEPTMEETVATLAAKLAAEMLVDLLAKQNAPTEEPVAVEEEPVAKPVAAKRTRKAKPTAKSAAKTNSVVLNVNAEKVNSYQFKYMGASKSPLVSACYITLDAVELLEAGETLTATFERAEGKKPSILLREVIKDTSVFNGSLYLMRDAAKALGINIANGDSADVSITVTAVSTDDHEVTLTASVA